MLTRLGFYCEMHTCVCGVVPPDMIGRSVGGISVETTAIREDVSAPVLPVIVKHAVLVIISKIHVEKNSKHGSIVYHIQLYLQSCSS